MFSQDDYYGYRFTLKPAETSTLRLPRLDVGDVLLTDEEPSALVRGTFFVLWNGANIYRAPTGTGVSLPPGEYDVRIKYQSKAGAERVLEHHVVLK